MVWTQGCRVHCAGCNAVGSWAFAPETAVPVDALVARLSPLLGQADGVTISGGEPFDQPVAQKIHFAGVLSSMRKVPSTTAIQITSYPCLA